MKTCKDCIYWVETKGSSPLCFGIGECHLYPKAEETGCDWWCGQLKEGINMETHHLLIEWARQPENAVKILGMMK